MARIYKAFVVLVMITLSATLGLLMGEMAVRILIPQDMLSNFSWYQSNEKFKFKHRANIEKLARWGDVYHLKTNSVGLREDREIGLNKGNQWRIAVLGDSFVFGNGVEKKDLFVTRIEQSLNSGSKECAQVINFGVSAFGPGQELMYYRESVSKYEPDVVILGIFMGNDVLDDVRDGLFIYDGVNLTHVPYKIGLLKKLSDTAGYQWLASNSQLFILLRRTISQYLDGKSVRTATGGQAVSSNKQDGNVAGDGRFNKALSTTEAIWKSFVYEVRANDATPILLLLPSKNQILAKRGDDDGKDETRISMMSYGILKKICADEGLLCVDMLSYMVSEDIERLFIKDDFHYNAAGHGLITRKLLENINQGRSGVIDVPCR